jgi:hypothetical protein
LLHSSLPFAVRLASCVSSIISHVPVLQNITK